MSNGLLNRTLLTSQSFTEFSQTRRYAFSKRPSKSRTTKSLKIDLRGHNKEFFDIAKSGEAFELMLSGPAETGKTITTLSVLHYLARTYPNLQIVIVRKVRDTLLGSVLQTYEKKILGEGTNVSKFGGEEPKWYTYPNGSRVWLAGMDKPGKALSSERDIIYVNQAEELDQQDWETLTTRATGRAGNAPFSLMIGDCNPGGKFHWIKQREAAGSLRIIESRHEDNPTLFDADGVITPQGEKSLAILDALTGVRKKRLRYGLWVSAEGMIYDNYDAAVHVLDPFVIPATWRRIRVVDFGYSNPFVCQWWAIDDDGRMYLYREIYRTHRLTEDHTRDILRLSEGERIEATIADHDAEDRATMERYGITTEAAYKAVSEGIQAVQSRLRVQGDGKPRLYILKNALVERDPLLDEKRKPLSALEEIEGYVWAKSRDGKPEKEEPEKKDDHGMDALRYAVAYVDNLAGEVEPDIDWIDV